MINGTIRRLLLPAVFLLCVTAPAFSAGAEESTSVSSAREEENTSVSVEPESEDDIRGNNMSPMGSSFVWELMKRQNGSGENVMLSPLSILSAMDMAGSGAGGETRRDMEEVLAGGASLEELTGMLGETLASMQEQEGVSFHNANSVWISDRPDVRVRGPYTELLKNTFGAELYKEVFSPETPGHINAWVNEHTNGMIPEIVGQLDEDTAMCLVNALAFEGEWQEPYEEDQIQEEGLFFGPSDKEEWTSYLHSTENTWLEWNGAAGFKKPYKGGAFSFFALLPPEGTTPEELLGQIDANVWHQILDAASVEKVEVTLPEFTIDFDAELKETLKDMGLGSAFEGADFTEMFEGREGDYAIGSVLHKTHFALDRMGTKASAATMVQMMVGSALDMEMPKRVRLDRPFVCGIIGENSEIPVFLGVVNSVE